MNYRLFIDNKRSPTGAFQTFFETFASGVIEEDWVVVRSYDEGVDIVEEFGAPEFVQFAYNLGPDSKNGAEFAEYLIQRDRENLGFPKAFAIHSEDRLGSRKIRKLMEGHRL